MITGSWALGLCPTNLSRVRLTRRLVDHARVVPARPKPRAVARLLKVYASSIGVVERCPCLGRLEGQADLRVGQTRHVVGHRLVAVADPDAVGAEGLIPQLVCDKLVFSERHDLAVYAVAFRVAFLRNAGGVGREPGRAPRWSDRSRQSRSRNDQKT